MFKRIGNLLAKDLVYSGRESILVYSLVVSLVLAVGALFFLPSMEQMDIRIAVDESVQPEVARQLEAYARVEYYRDFDRLQERVLAFDDTPGIFYAGGEYVVLLEGNEESSIHELPGIILDRILHGEDVVELSTVSLGRERSPVREITTIFFLLAIIQVGGIFIGFNIVNDRQSGSIRALAVSPINAVEYMIGKSILGMFVVVVLTLAVTTILLGPTAINYPPLLLSVIASLGVVIFIGFLIGLFSNNMITAIAIIKVIGLFISGVVVAALLLPDGLKWLLYPFPNYWSVEAFYRVLIRRDLPLAPVNLAAALYSLVLVVGLVSRFGRELRLTIKGGR